MFIPTRAMLNAIMKALSSGAGADSINLGTCSIGLLNAPFSPSVDSTMGSVSAAFATYDGYALQALTSITTPFIGPGGLSEVEALRMVFRPTDSTIPNTIYETYLTAPADSTTLWGVEVLDNPVPLPSPSYQLTYVPRVGLTPGPLYGAGLASN